MNHLHSPSVVSTGCSRIKSIYFTCHRFLGHSESSPSILTKASSKKTFHHSPTISQHSSATHLPSPYCFTDGKAAAQAYWKRAHQLELELIQLNKWLSIERELRDSLYSSNGSLLSELEMERTREGLVTDLEVERTHKDRMRTELIRLLDGGYVHGINTLSRHWGRLTLQVSTPAIIPAEIGYNVSQVLLQMASMGTDNLSSWLLESLPMGDIWYNKKMKIKGSPVKPGSENGFMEAIVLGAIKNMGILATEGLKIQMGARERVVNEVVQEERAEPIGDHFVLVMLIQLRYPEKGYEAVGENMIGLVEASVVEEESGFLIEGFMLQALGADLGMA